MTPDCDMCDLYPQLTFDLPFANDITAACDKIAYIVSPNHLGQI